MHKMIPLFYNPARWQRQGCHTFLPIPSAPWSISVFRPCVQSSLFESSVLIILHWWCVAECCVVSEVSAISTKDIQLRFYSFTYLWYASVDYKIRLRVVFFPRLSTVQHSWLLCHVIVISILNADRIVDPPIPSLAFSHFLPRTRSMKLGKEELMVLWYDRNNANVPVLHLRGIA